MGANQSKKGSPLVCSSRSQTGCMVVRPMASPSSPPEKSAKVELVASRHLAQPEPGTDRSERARG